MDYRK